ncbi:MAG TPA: hypothetical protein HA254_02910 [Candidatus Diapherotrites archaeon]|uniref:Uncharacterized protein n=1 Tax=Candidatus Iainarchaeum sp. TaxID=3101447 RepID=A0A7J4IZA9_9ARCH|nr:hypothetical protein [Candidatus Diapherotrites archaeon]
MAADKMTPNEKMRKKLLEEEFKLRKKQPEHWAKTMYRKFAKPYTAQEMEKIKELGEKREKERSQPHKKKHRGKHAQKIEAMSANK